MARSREGVERYHIMVEQLTVEKRDVCFKYPYITNDQWEDNELQGESSANRFPQAVMAGDLFAIESVIGAGQPMLAQ